jgi:hypothetical protein
MLQPRGDTAISAVDTPAGPGFEVANQSARREIAWIGHLLTITIRSHELLAEAAQRRCSKEKFVRQWAAD